MKTVEQIKSAIEKLAPDEFASLRAWIANEASERWDAQLKADATAGKLDAFAVKAVKEFKRGRCTDL